LAEVLSCEIEEIYLELGLGSDGAFLGLGLEDIYCFCNGVGRAMIRWLGVRVLQYWFAGILLEELMRRRVGA
jgi:hypothetical protein